MAELSERDRKLIGFLRNLSGGFSSFRLFGGDLQQPGFVEAVNRVKTTSETALAATGKVRVRVHGDQFISDSGPLPDDEAYRRLAMACYERRVEEITLASVPTKQDLASLYDVLSTAAEEIAALGGAPRALATKGVESIRLNEALVTPTESTEGAEGAIPEPDALADGLDRLDEIAEELMRDPRVTDANSVYRLLREVVSALPPDKASDPDTYRRLREAVEKLPEEVRTSLSSMLISNVSGEDMAERLIGTMTDTSLARLLVDVSRQSGADPLELARELVVGGFRRHDLVELATVATEGTFGSEHTAPEGVGGDRSNLLDAVAELISTDVKTHTEEDELTLRAEFPATEERRTAEALITFADYLRVDDDHLRLESALDSWARATRTAVREDDMARATQLVEVADHAYESLLSVEPERAKLISDAKAKILDPDLVAELAAEGSQGEGGVLLSLFGDVAVEALLQRLAEEEVGARRSTLIGIVSGLVGDHHGELKQWVKDDRWFVVRNVMTIVQRSGMSSEMLKVIDVGIRHPHPAVRKEAVRALSPAGGDALPRLVVLATDEDREVAAAAVEALGSVALIAAEGEAASIGEVVRIARDLEVRKKALQILARHPSEEATEVLQSIARFGSKPRAPFAIRRQAKALARERRSRA
ncbi:MAG: hypothetical protein QOG54_2696 [Actinomycetota bacterium]|nr:hypothetical protein [Actinomycetota bacterium]